MPVDYRAPNINARTLGMHLRRIREVLELSYDEAADLLDRDATWLIRLETGFERVTPDQMRELLDGYGVPQHHIRGVLIDLASRPAGPPWLARRAGRMKALVRDLLTLESESPFIHTYGPRSVPELVRTESYARMCLAHRRPGIDAVQQDQEWDLLDHRQRHRPGGRPRVLDVIVDEHCLSLPAPDPGVMRGQLGRLLDLSEDEQTTVRVVPVGVGAHAGLDGAFDVLEFPPTQDRVSLVHGALGIDLAPCDLSDTWELIERVALPPGGSRDVIGRYLAELPAG